MVNTIVSNGVLLMAHMFNLKLLEITHDIFYVDLYYLSGGNA